MANFCEVENAKLSQQNVKQIMYNFNKNYAKNVANKRSIQILWTFCAPMEIKRVHQLCKCMFCGRTETHKDSYHIRILHKVFRTINCCSFKTYCFHENFTFAILAYFFGAKGEQKLLHFPPKLSFARNPNSNL